MKYVILFILLLPTSLLADEEKNIYTSKALLANLNTYSKVRGNGQATMQEAITAGYVQG